MTKVELRRWETKSTFLHHSLLPITRRGFLRLALITSDIRELITLWRSTLLQEILDFARSIDLTKGVIHTGSLDESLTHLSSMHLSIRAQIFFSMLSTTQPTLFPYNTSLQSSAVIETRVKVWENEKGCGNTSRRGVFPQLFRVLPNFQEVLPSSMLNFGP